MEFSQEHILTQSTNSSLTKMTLSFVIVAFEMARKNYYSQNNVIFQNLQLRNVILNSLYYSYSSMYLDLT